MTLDEHIHKAEEDAKMAEFDTEWGIGNYFIDRTEALEYAKEHRQLAEWLRDYKRLKEQERTGHWVKGKCDQCGGHAPFWSMATTYYESEYCPKCGTRMESEQNG